MIIIECAGRRPKAMTRLVEAFGIHREKPTRVERYMLNMNRPSVESLRTLQAQVEMTKGELIGELRAKVVTTTIKEVSPIGIRLEFNGMGEVKGKLDRDHMETANLVVKTDGSFEWESKAIETTKEGDMVVALGSGKGRPTGATTSSWEGEIHYMTQSPRLSWMNNTSAIVEGTWDRVAREYQGKAYAKK